MGILDRFRLDGEVAVVTGAGKGIGRTIAIALAEAGADVVVASRTQADLDVVAAEITAMGRRALPLATDATDLAALERLAAATIAQMGKLTIWVNNAGGIPDGTDFYFVHSYAFVAANEHDVLATTDCGVPVTAAVKRGHVWGTQFHPEKDSRAGFQLLRNFIAGPPC
ncbi:MAG: SDR family NAD(P)-dependent oxidoreductase [Sphingomonadales bacterium]|nr:SDR family NAD(P)-dependent oxidoreductase [Sphingomonadales bacterium]